MRSLPYEVIDNKYSTLGGKCVSQRLNLSLIETLDFFNSFVCHEEIASGDSDRLYYLHFVHYTRTSATSSMLPLYTRIYALAKV